MKSKLAFVVCLVLALGCADKSAQFATGTSVSKPKVALIMKSLANEFFSTMANGAKLHQADNAERYDLIVNGIKDERDISRQVALVEEMLALKVDAIVIAPADSKALIKVLDKAKSAGVVVVNIDNRLDQTVLEEKALTIPFVGPDNKAGARKVGEYLAAKLEAGDTVCVLEGIRSSFNGQQRREGFEAAMEAANIKIADSQSAEWEMNKANSVAASMLSEHPETKAILASNDSMALGAIAAVKSAGKAGEVMVVGFDNISAVQQAIRDGRILATADQHGDQLAVYGIEAALNMLNTPETTPDDLETPVDLITPETLTQ